MRIVLINPPMALGRGNIWRSVASVMPPLGLAWIAAVLEREGHGVTILDAQALRLTWDAIAAETADWEGAELVGITATTRQIVAALEIARLVKPRRPRARVVIGGVHATVLSEEVLREPAVDLVVRGEGERTMLELAAGKPVDEVRGVSFRDAGAIRHNPDRELIQDLDALPSPAYHLLPMGRYHPAPGAYRRLPGVSMLATRGCLGRCTFCCRIFGLRLRVRSGERIAQEAKDLQDRFGIREACFYDDTFTAVRREVLRFCQTLADLRANLTWSCFGRVDTVDQEMLTAMKAAGCHQIVFGIESANAEILKTIRKGADLDQAEQAIRLAKKAGIRVRTAFMLGNPGETPASMQETLDWAIRMDPDLAMFNIATPYPGTELFDWAAREGYLRTREWDRYDLAHMVMDLPSVSAAEVERFYRTAYRRFFFRPAYVARRLRQVRTLADAVQLFRGARAVGDL